MACAEITAAMVWIRKSKGNDVFSVTAFLTRHQAVLSNTNGPSNADICLYAVGPVRYVPDGIDVGGHLTGDLDEYWNLSPGNAMVKSPNVVRVQIFEDGTVIFQDSLNGNPIPSPIKVTTTCVGGVLLTGTYGRGVITVGLQRVEEDRGLK